MADDLKAKIASLEKKRDEIREEIKKHVDLRADLRSVERDLVELYNEQLRSKK